MWSSYLSECRAFVETVTLSLYGLLSMRFKSALIAVGQSCRI
jgi:hypothetical protein